MIFIFIILSDFKIWSQFIFYNSASFNFFFKNYLAKTICKISLVNTFFYFNFNISIPYFKRALTFTSRIN